MEKFDDYQVFTESTAIYPKENAFAYLTLGLCGEAGEVAEKVKKVIRDNKGEMTEEMKKEIVKEIYDCLWYISELSRQLGFKMSEGAQMNVDKLNSRKERNMLGGSGDNR